MTKPATPPWIARRQAGGAGLTVPVLFIGLVAVQGFLYDDYGHVSQPISALAAYTYGWVQNLSFLICGILMIIFGAGLRSTLARALKTAHPQGHAHPSALQKRGASVGPVLIMASGVGLILSGIFPMDRAGDVFVEPAGHIVAALITFLGAGTGLIVSAFGLQADKQFQAIAGPVLGLGVLMLVLFATFIAAAMPPGAPLHDMLGVVQRAAVGTWFLAVVLIALRLRRG